MERLDALLPLYTAVQNEYLRAVTKAHHEANQVAEANRTLILSNLEAQIEGLESQRRSLTEQINTARQERPRLYVRVVLWALRVGALAAFAVLVIIGCARYAWDHARSLTRFRTFGTFWWFNEGLGWVAIFSVILSPLGIIQVVSSQLFLIFQTIQQDTEHSPVVSSE